jgi:hypothetical protein
MKYLSFSSTFKNICIALVALIFASSCKKESSIADDPNIIYSSINKTIAIGSSTSIKDSIDINKDTRTDFIFLAGKSAGTDDTIAFYLAGLTSGSYIDSTKKLSYIFDSETLPRDETPEKYGTALRWAEATFLAAKIGANTFGHTNSNVYLPILTRNVNTGKLHYGWLQYNVSSDYKTIKIIDAAYNLIPDILIKMGAQ